MAVTRLQSLLQSGLTHHRAGRLVDADASYRQARAEAPRNFDVLHLSGLLAHQRGRIAEAVELLGRAHLMDRGHAGCEARYALALLAAKRFTDAEKHLRKAAEAQPAVAETWDHLAYCLKVQNRLSDAIGCHRKALAAKPDFALGWYNYGLTLSLHGDFEQALAAHERAIASDPKFTLGRFGRAQALHQANRLIEAVAEYDRFLQCEPAHHAARSYRLFARLGLEGSTLEEIYADHVAYGKALGPAPIRNFGNLPDPQRRLRVAILSPDLRQHSCAYFIEPLLQQAESASIELLLYHDHFCEDEVSARLRFRAARWRNFVGESDVAVEQLIRSDAPDVLIDLAGHTGMSNRLPVLGRRVAPVQITYLGYPDTTGVPAMDYRFTDAVADPVDVADKFATERLVRFAPSAWAYAPPVDAPAVAAPPCLARGYVTFGSFNHLSKLTDSTLQRWAEIVRRVPGARLRLKGRGLSDAATERSYHARLRAAGFAEGEVFLTERTAGVRQHLAQYAEVDIALDTFPYHGTTTTCEALWMGVPVVTLLGDRHVSRVGASLLRSAGHPEWVAQTPDHYIAIAVALARDCSELVRARTGLRADLANGPLMDHAGQSQRFFAAIRDCWRTWCATQTQNLRVA